MRAIFRDGKRRAEPDEKSGILKVILKANRETLHRFSSSAEIFLNSAFALFVIILPVERGTASLYYILLGFMALYLINSIIGSGASFRSAKTPCDLPLFAFAGWCFFSLVWSIDLHITIRYLVRDLMAYIVVYYSTIIYMRKKERLEVLVRAFLLSHLLILAVGLYQLFFSFSEKTWRIESVFGNPNMLGNYLIVTLPVFFVWYEYNLRNGHVKINNFLIIPLITLTELELVHSGSRGAWAGSILGAASLMLFLKKRGSIYFAAHLLLLVFFVFLPLKELFITTLATHRHRADISPAHHSSLVKRDRLPAHEGMLESAGILPLKGNYLFKRFSSLFELEDIFESGKERRAFLGVRYFLWRDTLKMLKTRPITGFGYGTNIFLKVYGKYRSKEVPLVYGHAHNFFLQIAVEVGIVGLLLLCASLFKLFYHSWKSALKIKELNIQKLILIAFSAGFLALALSNQVDYAFRERMVKIFWLWAGIMVSISTERQEENGDRI